MNIVEFLEARIAEDESAARAASSRSLEWRSFRGSVHGGTITEPNPEWGDEPDEGYGSITIVYDEGSPRVPEAGHIARHDPARVLAECAAKRAIIKLAVEIHDLVEGEWGGGHEVFKDGWQDNHGNDVVRTLAAIYKDHSDYRQDWA